MKVCFLLITWAVGMDYVQVPTEFESVKECRDTGKQNAKLLKSRKLKWRCNCVKQD